MLPVVPEGQGEMGTGKSESEVTKGAVVFDQIPSLADRCKMCVAVERRVAEERDLGRVLEAICDAVIRLGFRMCWVGLAEEDKSVSVKSFRGFEEGYLNDIGVRWDDSPQGCGPTGMAIKTGRPSAMKDILGDPRFEPWRKRAIARGYQSSFAFPLFAFGKAVGALNVYSERKDGFTVADIQNLVVLAERAGLVIEAAVIIRDREEELERTRERLLESEKLAAIGRLASLVAHELRSPLGAILNAAWIVKKSEDLKENEKRYLDVIGDQVKKVNRIISDLVTYASRPEPDKRAFSAELAIREEVLRIAVPANVTVNVPDVLDQTYLFGDEEHLRKIIRVIVENGVEFLGDRGGVIEISLCEVEKDGSPFIEIAVKNNGPEIPGDIREKIFEPFFSTKAVGSGLGLTIAKLLARANNGDVALVESSREWTTFVITFPRAGVPLET